MWYFRQKNICLIDNMNKIEHFYIDNINKIDLIDIVNIEQTDRPHSLRGSIDLPASLQQPAWCVTR